MITIYEKETGKEVGKITQEHLQFLISQLEEEYIGDQDYAISSMLLAYFGEKNADPELIAVLKNALGEREEVIICWEES